MHACQIKKLLLRLLLFFSKPVSSASKFFAIYLYGHCTKFLLLFYFRCISICITGVFPHFYTLVRFLYHCTTAVWSRIAKSYVLVLGYMPGIKQILQGLVFWVLDNPFSETGNRGYRISIIYQFFRFALELFQGVAFDFSLISPSYSVFFFF